LIRLGGLFGKQRRDRELADELEFHLQMQIAENLRSGMSAAEARRQALIACGGLEAAKESYRDRRSLPALDTPIQDLAYGLRIMRRSPGFTATAVLTLALGIGATTAIFTLIEAVMLRSLPVREPQSLVVLKWRALQWPQTKSLYGWSGCPAASGDSEKSVAAGCSFSQPVFEQIRAEQSVFSGVFAVLPASQRGVSIDGQASLASVEFASGDFFPTLEVRAVLGRTFGVPDDTADALPVAVLSYTYWQRQFGSDASAVGKPIVVSGVPFTVIGVAEPGFGGLDPGISRDMWLPLSSQAQLDPGLHKAADAASWYLLVIARLRRGVTVAQAEAMTNVVFRRNVTGGANAVLKPQDVPEVKLINAARGLASLRKKFTEPLLLLMVAVAIVLLIACANVASLMLVRCAARQKEMAVRLALGARPGRIIRQVLTESVMLAGFGGGLGTLVALWSARPLAAFLSSNWYMPLEIGVRPDLHVLAFAFLAALLCGVLVGIAPAFRGAGVGLAPALKSIAGGISGKASAGPRFGLGKVLVIAQVGLSVIVLIAAGLLARTLANLETVNIGFNTRNLLLLEIDTSSGAYGGQRYANLYSELQDRLSAIPGVLSVSYSSPALLAGAYTTEDIHLRGQSGYASQVDSLSVGPNFFETLGIPLLSGRYLSPTDFGSASQGGHRAVIVNETFAKRFFGDRSPIGQWIGLEDSEQPDTEIVGVVGDAKYNSLRREIEATIYLPLQSGRGALEVRSAGDARLVIPAIREAVSSLHRNLPISRLKTQSEQIDQTIYQERLIAGLSSILGLVSLGLAAMGLYGLLAYGVVRRTHEIGIRLALGAQQRDIVGEILAQGIRLASFGAVIGVSAAAGLTRYVASMLYGIPPLDPATFAGVPVLLMLAALGACYVPARHATRLSPMVALRYE
jgi:predicted permease